MKFDIKNITLTAIISLTLVTIMSAMLSQFTDIPTIRSGGSFVLLLVVTFLVYIFVAAQDRKIDRGEVITIIIIAIALIISGVALNKFMPEIFIVMPDATKQFFSAFIN